MVQNDKKTAKRQSKRKSNHLNLNDRQGFTDRPRSASVLVWPGSRIFLRVQIFSLLILDESIDLDFEKTESDIFENDEDIEELLERQEEIIEQARCLRWKTFYHGVRRLTAS